MCDLTKEIEKQIAAKELKKQVVAERCGWSAAGLSNRLRSNNFSIKDLERIAEAVDMTLEISFIPKGSHRAVPGQGTGRTAPQLATKK